MYNKKIKVRMDLKYSNKLVFKRSEVIRITKLDGKVLDFWEKEFNSFKSSENKNGDKFYSRSDVENILLIKKYLIEDKLKKDEIKKRLDKGGEFKEIKDNENNKKLTKKNDKILSQIKKELKEILTLLDKNDK